MHDIRTRLLQAEDSFLSTLSRGSLEDFEQEWARLSNDIAVALRANQLAEDIQSLANTVSCRIQILATSFLELDEKCQELTDSFLQDVEYILAEERQVNSQQITRSAIPPYIPPAYTWLLKNLHCPYPSVTMRNSLAKSSGSNRRAIDGWFVDVRKRIGWNALRRSQFAGKKDDIVQAATQYFLYGGGGTLAPEFASIEATARQLYARKLGSSFFGPHHVQDTDSDNSSYRDDRAAAIPTQTVVYPSPTSLTSSLPPSPSILPPHSVGPPLKRTRPVEVEEEVQASIKIQLNNQPSKRQRSASVISTITSHY